MFQAVYSDASGTSTAIYADASAFHDASATTAEHAVYDDANALHGDDFYGNVNDVSSSQIAK